MAINYGKIRQNSLAKIHIAKKSVGWIKPDDTINGESYRVMLFRITGKNSTANMTDVERRQVLAEFKKMGWVAKVTYPKPKTGDWRKKRIAYIVGMWAQLGALSALNNPSPAGLALFCKTRMTGDDIKWASSAELNRIIEALKDWLARKGI